MASEVFCEHNVYVTKEVNITPGSDGPNKLCTGYHRLISMLKERYDTSFPLLMSPITTDSAIVGPNDIPIMISLLMRQFTATSRIKEKRVPYGKWPGFFSTDILR